MSIPPLRLLLPQTYRFNDVLPASLLVQSSTPVAALVIPFLLLAQERDRALRADRLAGGADPAELPVDQSEHCLVKTIVVNCYGTLERLVEEMHIEDGDVEPTPLLHFFSTDAILAGRFLEATEVTSFIHVQTLSSLLGILFILGAESRPDETLAGSPILQISDSQDSSTSGILTPEESRQGLLVVLGLDYLLRQANEWTGQGISRVAAACTNACGDRRHLIIHITPSEAEDGAIEEYTLPLLTASPALPASLPIPRVTVQHAFRPYVLHSWHVDSASPIAASDNALASTAEPIRSGLWKDDMGTRYRVTWQENASSGQCHNVRYTRIQ